MPTYDYRCEECGHEFEKFQSMMEDHLKKCPECNGKLKRLIGSGAGLIFKGTGFYITDYKKKETAVQGPVEKTTSSETEKKKPEKKKDEKKKIDAK